ncbi:hypothetical protein C4D60_Mb04t16500 [Musa balbisiana]|uniref:Uncharacterized protein n=1 Tax=Musa balbisiana TaxID=52838 RepID=A0A4V4H9T2_MUSBA|nr:hypothetical protein C4D60_Mb04t16500 [Musa balbisiana]
MVRISGIPAPALGAAAAASLAATGNCLRDFAALPRPHAQPTRCIGSSAPCAANTLLRPLGPMRTRCLDPSATACPRAPRPQLARGHTCAASPPASCSSTTCCPRPHLRGLPACVVFLGSMAFETHLRRLPACVVLLDPMTRDTPARPARLRRAPRLHVARNTPARPARLRRVPRSHVARDHTCAASPPASCSSAACLPETTLARPARLRRVPRLHGLRDTPARPARLRRVPRLHGLRDTPARPARLRRAPRPHDPRHTCAASPPASCSSATLHVARDHACAACPPAPCSSVARCPRPHLRGLPACVVFLGSMAFETHLHGLPACVVFLGSMAFETHLRGLPACVVLLDPMTRDTLARPARLRRAPRLLGCMPPRDHTCAASPPASCSSAPCSPRPHPRGQPT